MNYRDEITRLEREIAALKAKANGVEIVHQVRSADITDNEKWEVGDILRFTLLTGESIEAMCHHIDGDKAIFNTTHCLEKKMPIDSNYKINSWEDSELRQHLNTELLDGFPDSIRQRMCCIDGNDLITIPSMQDVFGDWDYDSWKPKKDGLNNRNWELMQHEQYRAKGNLYWLRDSYYYSSTGYFWCFVRSDGSADYSRGNLAFGLTPAFAMIQNP